MMTQPKPEMTPQEPEQSPDAAIQSPLSMDAEDGSDLTQMTTGESDAHDTQIFDLKDQLMRALAETENVRKRAQRDLEETNKYAVTGFARNLVSVLENLQRAVAAVSPEARTSNDSIKGLVDGVEMTLRELLGVFEKSGIKRIEPMGEKFDHNFHQAMVQIEDPNAEPGTILQVLQAGYVIHDRLLQPALVAVAKRGEPQSQLDTKA